MCKHIHLVVRSTQQLLQPELSPKPNIEQEQSSLIIEEDLNLEEKNVILEELSRPNTSNFEPGKTEGTLQQLTSMKEKISQHFNLLLNQTNSMNGLNFINKYIKNLEPLLNSIQLQNRSKLQFPKPPKNKLKPNKNISPQKVFKNKKNRPRNKFVKKIAQFDEGKIAASTILMGTESELSLA